MSSYYQNTVLFKLGLLTAKNTAEHQECMIKNKFIFKKKCDRHLFVFSVKFFKWKQDQNNKKGITFDMEENLPEPDPWKPLENVEASLGM